MIADRFPPDLGGLARSGARIAGSLARSGSQVDVLAYTKSLPPGALQSYDAGEVDPAAAGVTLHRFGLHANLDFSMQHGMNILDWLHGERDFNAVWGHYLFPAGFMAVLFAEANHLPSVVSARGNDIDRLTFPPGDFARLIWTLGRATRLTAVSRQLARKIDVLLGDVRDVEVLPNAVDTDLFSPGPPPAGLRAELGIAEDEAVLMFAGELREKKGLPFLLECLREVREERPACLVVIGEVRSREEARLASFSTEHPEAGRRLIVTGRLLDQARVAEHLRLGDVFLHPSLWDGLPNAVIEAMACERIVIASDAGGIPDCIEHGETGFLIPRHQLHRLAEAVLEIFGLPEPRRLELGRAARASVVERFRPKIEEKRLIEVLQRLLRESPSTPS